MSSSDTSFFRWRWMLLTLVLSLSLLPACDRGKGGGKDKAAAPAGPPPAVVVTPILQKTVPIYYEFVARTDSPNTVEIRARVQAYLEKQHFEEGTMVKKGQILFTLDKREYEAALEKVKAQIAQAEADLAFATDNAQVDTAKANLGVAVAKLAKADNDEKRLKPLADRQAVPQQDEGGAGIEGQAEEGHVEHIAHRARGDEGQGRHAGEEREDAEEHQARARDGGNPDREQPERDGESRGEGDGAAE